nr:MAG TPA: hypothetical protein [Caudoviricetes sp.]
MRPVLNTGHIFTKDYMMSHIDIICSVTKYNIYISLSYICISY